MRCVLPLPAPARTRTLRTTHQHAACESRPPRVKEWRSVAAGPMRRWTGRWLRPRRTRRSTRWCSSTRRCWIRSSRRWECENLQAIRGPWPLRLFRPPRSRIRAAAPSVFEPWCHRRSAVWSPEATLVFEHCPSGISGRGCPPPARDATAPKAVSPGRVFRLEAPEHLNGSVATLCVAFGHRTAEGPQPCTHLLRSAEQRSAQTQRRQSEAKRAKPHLSTPLPRRRRRGSAGGPGEGAAWHERRRCGFVFSSGLCLLCDQAERCPVGPSSTEG